MKLHGLNFKRRASYANVKLGRTEKFESNSDYLVSSYSIEGKAENINERE